MMHDFWTIAGKVLSDFALIDAALLSPTAWQIIIGGWSLAFAVGFLAALLHIPGGVCLTGFVLLMVKELALDIPLLGISTASLADSNLDLALPILGYLVVITLTQRTKQ